MPRLQCTLPPTQVLPLRNPPPRVALRPSRVPRLSSPRSRNSTSTCLRTRRSRPPHPLARQRSKCQGFLRRTQGPNCQARRCRSRRLHRRGRFHLLKATRLCRRRRPSLVRTRRSSRNTLQDNTSSSTRRHNRSSTSRSRFLSSPFVFASFNGRPELSGRLFRFPLVVHILHHGSSSSRCSTSIVTLSLCPFPFCRFHLLSPFPLVYPATHLLCYIPTCTSSS